MRKAAPQWIALLGLLASPTAVVPQNAAATPTDDDAARFGALEVARSLELSADGRRMVIVGPGPGAITVALVADLETGSIREVQRADGRPLSLRYCNWSASDRLVCRMYGITTHEGVRLGVVRNTAVNDDGSKPLPLGQRDAAMLQVDGRVIDWRDGLDGKVLMQREIGRSRAGRLTTAAEEGLAVDLVDTRTGKTQQIEAPDESAGAYYSDGRGTVRLRTLLSQKGDGTLRGISRHYYRKADSRRWHLLGEERADGEDTLVPLAVDSEVDAAYVLERLNGRNALYRIALDGSMKRDLVLAHPEVDVDDVVQLGRKGRVIGATYVTDRRQVVYLDPAYEAMATTLAKSLPKYPLVQFVSASADEKLVLVRASSDRDPGVYFLFDRERRSLKEVLRARRPLADRTLSEVKSVEYTARDGTRIPAYLTLPPGVTEARGLPAIVMPHGGPAARDEWGFDWFAQFFAQRGYAVLQPNYRGSAGYGDAWFVRNGFQNWELSVGDVCDGAEWLVQTGVANGARLAIVGWSYGGYAALQANVLRPPLFKATIAVAPVTDLTRLKTEALQYDSAKLVADYVGSGPHLRAGSPVEHAAAFLAPVLLFHGQTDLNVTLSHSQDMDRALKAAGRSSELVVYPDLDHELRDGGARADLLRRADAFLRTRLQLD